LDGAQRRLGADDDGGGIHHLNVEGGTVNIENSVLVRNLGDAGVENCFGSILSAGHNVEDADTCSLTAPGDIRVADALVGPLSDNGGSTLTNALLAGSPAIDSGNNVPCPATDQRGTGRPVDGNGDGVAVCDAGAYEAATPPSATLAPAPPSPTATPGSLPDTGGRDTGSPAQVVMLGLIPLALFLFISIWTGG
jgi:hypothetical protein